MPVPPPLKSPEPNDPQNATPSGVYKLVQSTAKQTVVQWGLIGSIAVGAAGFLSWGLNKLDLVNTAVAQVQVSTVANTSRLDRQEQRIEAVDAGTRQAVERLERKIDLNNEENRRMMQTLLEEVRKKR